MGTGRPPRHHRPMRMWQMPVQGHILLPPAVVVMWAMWQAALRARMARATQVSASLAPIDAAPLSVAGFGRLPTFTQTVNRLLDRPTGLQQATSCAIVICTCVAPCAGAAHHSADMEGASDGHDLGGVVEGDGSISGYSPGTRLYEEAIAHIVRARARLLPHPRHAQAGILRAHLLSHPQKRRHLLMQLVDAECTFRPAINRSKASLDAAAGGGAMASSPADTSPAYERLFARASEHKRKLEEAASRLDESCTFSPQVSHRARQLRHEDAVAGRSVYQSLYEKGKEREMRLADKREAAALDGCTFSPAITAKGRAAKRPGSAIERLYRPDTVKARNSVEHKCVEPTRATSDASACGAYFALPSPSLRSLLQRPRGARRRLLQLQAAGPATQPTYQRRWWRWWPCHAALWRGWAGSQPLVLAAPDTRGGGGGGSRGGRACGIGRLHLPP